MHLGPLEQLRAGRLGRRLPQLLLGLALYGVSMAMMLRSTLGLMPWDVLHDGVAGRLPLSFGQVVVATSLVVLLLWFPLRVMPGVGTIANAVLVGIAADLTLAVLAEPGTLAVRVPLLLGGIALNGVATALYIGAQLGPGPRDGLMTGLVRRTGWSVRLVRTSIEVAVVVAGWMLGGVAGVGTALYALSIGPLVQHLLPVLTVDLGQGPGGSGVSASRR